MDWRSCIPLSCRKVPFSPGLDYTPPKGHVDRYYKAWPYDSAQHPERYRLKGKAVRRQTDGWPQQGVAEYGYSPRCRRPFKSPQWEPNPWIRDARKKPGMRRARRKLDMMSVAEPYNRPGPDCPTGHTPPRLDRSWPYADESFASRSPSPLKGFAIEESGDDDLMMEMMAALGASRDECEEEDEECEGAVGGEICEDEIDDEGEEECELGEGAEDSDDSIDEPCGTTIQMAADIHALDDYEGPEADNVSILRWASPMSSYDDVCLRTPSISSMPGSATIDWAPRLDDVRISPMQLSTPLGHSPFASPQCSPSCPSAPYLQYPTQTRKGPLMKRLVRPMTKKLRRKREPPC